MACHKGTLPFTGPKGSRRVKPADVLALRGRGRPRADGTVRPGSPERKLREALDPAQREVLSYCLYFAALSGRLDERQAPLVRDLMVRFSRANLADIPQAARFLERASQGEPLEDVPPPVHLRHAA